MARYFTARSAKPLWVADHVYDEPVSHLPSVSDHHAVDTGLIDANGNAIMRAPNPASFGKDEEW